MGEALGSLWIRVQQARQEPSQSQPLSGADTSVLYGAEVTSVAPLVHLRLWGTLCSCRMIGPGWTFHSLIYSFSLELFRYHKIHFCKYSVQWVLHIYKIMQ